MSKEKRIEYPKELEKPRYMIALKYGVPKLCFVSREDKFNFIGHWAVGKGFFNVRFPKETTRELTEKEKTENNGVPVVVSNRLLYIIETKENPIPVNAFKATVENNSVLSFGEADEEGTRTISSNREVLPFKKCNILFMSVGKKIIFNPIGINKMVTTREVISIKQ